jgi:catechol 2,3-dioxygenase-like lactoylglutathione lyase family enzyme
MLSISHIDHIVLTVADINTSIDFYTQILGMRKIEFGAQRIALEFGTQKINLHQQATATTPKAAHPTLGSGDICLITKSDITQVQHELTAKDIPIELGPVMRTGACGAIVSLYIRDPDANLIEIAQYAD